MRQLANIVKVPLLLGAVAVAAMLAGGTTAKAQGWHHGDGDGYYRHGDGDGYYNHGGRGHDDGDWHRHGAWVEPPVEVYYGPSYHHYHYHNWGHRRYYSYNGNRWYINLNTGIRVEL